MIGRDFVTAPLKNFILRYNDLTQDRLTWKSIYSSVPNKWRGTVGIGIAAWARKRCQVLISEGS